MKKLMAMMMAALLVLSLAACGGKADASGKEDAVPENLDLNEVYQALMDLQPEDDAPVMLPESNPEIIDGFYPGLSDITLKQQVFYTAPVTGFATEVMLVEVSDAGDLDTVKEIFQQRIDAGSDASGCYPETAEIWSSRAVVQSAGNYAAMIVLPDNCTIPDDVFAM